MSTLSQLENTLFQIKTKASTFRSQRQINRYLHNYKESPELCSLAESLSGLKISDLSTIIDRRNIADDEISYQNLLEDAPHYSVGLFFFPKGSYIPLHDHLNLLVFSKVLSGNLQITSYDKLNESDKNM
jgi:hypothetical protein